MNKWQPNVITQETPRKSHPCVPSGRSPLHGGRGEGGYRRLANYDYTRGGAIFITIALAPRRPLFGRVENGRMILSPAGETALAALREVSARYANGVRLHRYCIMPDHVHLRLSWPPGLEHAVKSIGNFIGRFKQFTHYRIAGHAPSIWEDGYFDIVCRSARMTRIVDAYIDNNPMKGWLMHGDSTLLHVREPFPLPEAGADELWRAVGAADLLDRERLVALRISRRVPTDQIPRVVDDCARAAAQKGYTYVSTFYSPGERVVRTELARLNDAAMIRLVPTFMDMAYRPHGDEAPLFAKGRLLVLSRAHDPGEAPTRAELLDLNAIAVRLATASSGGKAVYVQPGPTYVQAP